MIHVRMGLMSILSLGSSENLSRLKFKCITNTPRKQVKQNIKNVLLVTFNVLDIF